MTIQNMPLGSVIKIITDFFKANLHTEEGRLLLESVSKRLTNGDVTNGDLFNRIYVEPYFLNENEPSEYDASDFKLGVEGFNCSFDRALEDISKLKRSKTDFEDKLTLKVGTFLMVLGCSGSGKSTYIGKLLDDKKNINFEAIRFDFDKATQRSIVLSDGEVYELNPTAKGRFELLALQAVKNFMEKIVNNKQRLEHITKSFELKLSNSSNIPKWMSDIFVCLEMLSQNYSVDDVNTAKPMIYQIISSTREAMKTEFLNENSMVSDNGLANIIKKWLSLLVVFKYCDADKYYAFVFDSIEFLIGTDLHIYDPSIDFIIRSVLHEFTKEQDSDNAILKMRVDDKTNKFSENFVFIVCARDTTLRQVSLDNVQESRFFKDNSINISRWFWFSELYEKRIEFLEIYLKNNPHFNLLRELVDIIMKDTNSKKKGNSLMDMLEPMYNHDKRSIAFYFFEALEKVHQQYSGVIIKNFKNYWDEFIYENNERKNPYRYLCRRAVLRLIFNNIRFSDKQNIIDDIFHYASTSTGKLQNDINTTYVRKILLYLSNNQTDKNNLTNGYMSINTLFKKVLKTRTSGEQVSEGNLDKFIELLFLMGNYEAPLYKWHQLITIKYNDKDMNTAKLNFNDFREKMLSFMNTPKGGTQENYGFKINYAGIFIAYYQTDFEFFACRYCGDDLPLIFLTDVKKITKTIQTVYHYAKICMKTVLIDEYHIFNEYGEMKNEENDGYLYVDNDGSKVPHPVRVIKNHITYLEHYEHFVKSNTQTNNETGERHSVFNENDKDELLLCISEHITNYEIALRSLWEGYAPPATAFEADKHGEPHLCSRPHQGSPNGKPYMAFYRDLVSTEHYHFDKYDAIFSKR